MSISRADLPLPIERTADGVRIAVKVTPRASADRLNGVAAEADGALALRAQVTAAPEDGKANAALCALLAKRLDVPKSAIAVVHGATGRRKTVAIAGDPATLAARIGSRSLDG
ncbi:MAG: DUF167 family protein [Alphaproteobacteria bacterium]